MSLETGTSLGPYEIVARVGAGAMGEVYRARDTRLGRTVAIKILQRAVGDDRASRERFEREARAASSLNHPHICTVFDVGRDGAVDFLVMEFLDGQTLAERVAAGSLPVEEVVTRGIEIAGALESAHRHHLVHRDLKPSNVMVTDTGAKLLDFGLVKRTPDPAGPTLADATRALEVTQPGIVVGTVSYMSPEQARGQEVDVRAILMGTVRQVGESLVIGVELIDAADGSQLWGAQYSRQPDDILSVQDDIASRISETLKVHLTGDQKKRLRTARQTVDGEAYRSYLQGRFCLNRRSEEQLERAVQYFEAAIARAPDYAPAWAGLADACALGTGGGSLDTDSQSIIDRARTSAAKALALDPDLADAHASMAFVKFRLDWDWRAAEGEFSKALVLNPGHAPTRHWHGMFLAARGRFDEALDEMRRAAELDPMSLIVMAGIAKVLYFAGRYNEAVEQDQKIIQLDRTFMNAWFDMGFALLVGGRHDEAMEVFKKIPVFTERLGGEAMELPWFHAVIGDLDRARASLARLQAHGAPALISPAEYAFTYAALGEWEESHRWLTRACEQRSGLLTYMHVDPLLRELITYPPSRALLDRYGLTAP